MFLDKFIAGRKLDYPKEFVEYLTAILHLSGLKYYTKHENISAPTLKKSTNTTLFDGRKTHVSPSTKHPRFSNTCNFATMVQRKPFDDQEDDNNNRKRQFSAQKLPFCMMSKQSSSHFGSLPRKPQPLQLEVGFEFINNYNPLAIPLIPGLNGLIGRCSKPFEKRLTESDLRDDLSRLLITQAYVQNHLYPMLEEGENLDNGINVTTYDQNGKEFKMVFKLWSSKFHVLTKGWKLFFHEHELEKDRDFITLWMFRRLDTHRLCFAINWRRLPVSYYQIKRKRVRND